MLDKIICIYMMINNITGQMYIGQTNNFSRRIYDHFKGWAANEQWIDRACLKYGRENFTVKILETFEEYDKEVLDSAEKFYITAYNTFQDDFHYNLTPGGDGFGAGKDNPAYRDDLDDDVLVKDYIENKLNCGEIAIKYNTCKETVRNRLNNLGIDTSCTNSYRDDLDDDVLVMDYVENKLNCGEIARKYNAARTTVINRLNNLGINTSRDKSRRNDLDDNVLANEYLNNKLSCREIARKYNTDGATVRYRLNKLGIDTSRDAHKNTTGYYRVSKLKDYSFKQGFTWRYQYCDENGKNKSVQSVDLKKLEIKVKEKGLPWKKL